jgi:YlmC/YmxH family sporulation protein
MRVSDLQTKDVVSLIDGKRLGRIVDIDMEESGIINYFVVEQRRFFRFFGGREEVNVRINQIKKIGEDVILVEI